MARSSLFYYLLKDYLKLISVYCLQEVSVFQPNVIYKFTQVKLFSGLLCRTSQRLGILTIYFHDQGKA